MSTFTTLTEALAHHAARELERNINRGVTFINGENRERFVSYRNLQQRATGILRYFQQKGMQPGDELMLLVNQGEQFIDSFWAALHGKIVAVPLAVGINQEHRLKVFRIFRLLKKPYLYTDRANLNRLASFAEENGLNAEFEVLRQRTVLVEDISDVSVPGQVHSAQPDDLAFIQFSSGSTSTPKGVALTHRNLMANIEAMLEGIAMTDQDVCLSWMPLTHDMGLIGFHLALVVAGIAHVIMATELFVKRPLLWWQKIAAHQATITCSPNFGYQHFLNALDKEPAVSLDASSVRLIFNGAEPISVGLCEKFTQRMKAYGLPAGAMFPVYGLAEASLAVSFPEPGAALRVHYLDRAQLQIAEKIAELPRETADAMPFVSEGKPVKHCSIQIRNESGEVLGEEMLGLIYIKGTNVTKGYYRDELANQLLLTADGWLNTGDLGFMKEGRLAVTGRYKDIIFHHGQNFYPHDLEALALEAESVEAGKVAACGVRTPDSAEEQVVVFVVYKGQPETFVTVAKEVKKLLNERIGLEVAYVIPLKQLPKTTSGKIQRYRLAERFLQGEFEETLQALNAAMAVQSGAAESGSASEVEQVLLEICETYLNGRKLSLDDNLFEIGTSSLALTQIHEKIDERWPGKLDITDYFDYPTIAQLAAYLKAQNEKINS